MLNIEKYAEEIREIGKIGEMAVTKKSEVVSCFILNCSECLFSEKNCNPQLIEWLLEEYKEKPEVTEAEYHFCKIIKNGGLFKDKGGDIHWTADDNMSGFYAEPAVDVLYKFDNDLRFNYLKTGRENAISIQELIEIYEEAHGIQK